MVKRLPALTLLWALSACQRVGFVPPPRDAGVDARVTPPASHYVLGQRSPIANDNLRGGFNFPASVGACGERLLVADTNDHRILGWSSVAEATSGAAPYRVLGQPGLETGSFNYGGRGPRTLAAPRSVFCDGSAVYVADTLNHRVLIWTAFPSQDYAPADLVLGESAAPKLREPRDVIAAAGKLIVADTLNHRVLIWNTIPAVAAAADVVLGQPDMGTTGANTGGRSARSLDLPYRVASDGSRLAVVDHGNNRVLIWSSIPAASNAPADLVLGQKSFTSGAAGTGAGLRGPGGVLFWGGRLVVSDTGNNRVLVWDAEPSVSGAPADRVLGQASLSSSAEGVGPGALSRPLGLSATTGHLLVADYGNSRVVLFDAASLASGAAVGVVGQPDLNTGCPKGSHVDASTLSGPESMWTDGSQLLVADLYVHRVLRWATMPAADGAPASQAIGQPGLAACAASATTSGAALRYPRSVAYDGKRLFVTDASQHRVLIWNGLPAAGAGAELVLGQPDMTSGAENAGGATSASSLEWPSQLWTDGQRLLVVDPMNNRVLIWSTIPQKSNAPADLVIGQPDMTSSAYGATARDLHAPNDVSIDGGRLFVADSGNSRVLIWHTVPTQSHAPADVVLGQPDMTTSGDNTGGLSARSMRVPRGLHAAGGRLFVADTSNHRVLRWDAIPTVQGAPADRVYGQPDMASDQPNAGGMSATSLYYPGDVYTDSERLFIVDTSNDRVLVTPLD